MYVGESQGKRIEKQKKGGVGTTTRQTQASIEVLFYIKDWLFFKNFNLQN